MKNLPNMKHSNSASALFGADESRNKYSKQLLIRQKRHQVMKQDFETSMTLRLKNTSNNKVTAKCLIVWSYFVQLFFMFSEVWAFPWLPGLFCTNVFQNRKIQDLHDVQGYENKIIPNQINNATNHHASGNPNRVVLWTCVLISHLLSCCDRF